MTERGERGGSAIVSPDPARARKLADRIQQIVAGMLERRIKDPRLGFVTVTDARVTADLRDATVYYTVFGTEAEQAETAAALESAKGVLRSEVGHRLGVRHTPSLTFVPDTAPANARHIDALLEQARKADAEVAKLAESAEHVGKGDRHREPGDGSAPAEPESDEDDTDASHGWS